MRRFRPGLWPTLFTVPVLILALALGWWQLERRAWKHELTSRLEARLAAPPTTTEQARRAPEEAEFRRISLDGRFLHEHEQHFPSRTLNGRVGTDIMTPFVLEDSSGVVLVDRGWVPQEARDPALRPDSRPEGALTIEGIVRLPPLPNWFTPDNAPDRNEWFIVDLERSALHAGIEPSRMLPFYVRASAAGARDGLPVPRGSRIELVDNHLQYAITWFSLAAVLAVIYVLYHLRRKEDE